MIKLLILSLRLLDYQGTTIVEIKATSPDLTATSIEVSNDLTNWHQFTVTFLAPGTNTFYTPVPYKGAGYYRLRQVQ